jgi:hypothetical protein
LESPLYSLGADSTEITASNNLSIVVIGGCLARLDIVSAETCLLSRHQATHVSSSDRCIATVLHVTMLHIMKICRLSSFLEPKGWSIGKLLHEDAHNSETKKRNKYHSMELHIVKKANRLEK